MKRSKFHLSSKKKSEGGNVVIFALITSVVVGVGLLGTVTRSRYAGRSIARDSLAKNALDAAEAGKDIILENLNSQHPYLLVVNNSQWDNPPTYSTLCGTSSSGTPTQSGTVGTSASFELTEYLFNGNPLFGGTAYLRVKGSASNATNTTTATAILEQKVQIIPKKQDSCSGFPGLGLWASKKIRMRNNDIYGTFGNITCSNCNNDIPSNYGCSLSTSSLNSFTEADKECAINGKNNMNVDGDIFIGPKDFPPVPTLPSSLNAIAAANITSDTTLLSRSNDPSDLLDGSCVVESNIVHCKVDTINISGGDYFTIDNTSSDRSVRIYVSGDVTVSGNSKIEAVPLTECPTRVGLFGNPADADDTNDQEVKVSGNSKINNTFVYFPDAKVGVNGGGDVAYSCNNGDCDGGNFHGTVWAKEWGYSAGNKVRITVPSNMDVCFTSYFPDLGGFDNFGNTSFVGRGVLSHRTLKSE